MKADLPLAIVDGSIELEEKISAIAYLWRWFLRHGLWHSPLYFGFNGSWPNAPFPSLISLTCPVLTIFLKDPVSGAQQSGYWAVRETFAAVVVDNVPMIYPLFVKIFRRVETSMGSYHASRAKSPSGTSTTLGNSIRSPMSGKVNRFLHPLSLRHGVTSDSPRSFDDMDMDMAKGGRNIMIVKESTVDVRPKSSDEESRHEERPLHNADNGYAATCNPEPPSSRRKQDS